MITYHKLSVECTGNNGKEYRIVVEPDTEVPFYLANVHCLQDDTVVCEDYSIRSDEGVWKALNTALMVYVP